MPPKTPKTIPQPDVQIPAGDPRRGMSIFAEQCSVCHSMYGDNKNAPSLGGLIGRQAGSTEFRYSKAMKTAGFRWSPKHLFVYLQNPAKYVRGNKMGYTGLKREQDRADLIAFLVRYRQ